MNFSEPVEAALAGTENIAAKSSSTKNDAISSARPVAYWGAALEEARRVWPFRTLFISSLTCSCKSTLMWLCTYITSRACYKRSACHLDDFRHAKKNFPTSARKIESRGKIFGERGKNRSDANASRQYATRPRPIYRSSDFNPAQAKFLSAHCLRGPAPHRRCLRFPGSPIPSRAIVWL
jgi:hypothetical protein